MLEKTKVKEKRISELYIIQDNTLKRTNPFCPRCGRGVFMANHGDFWSCGKCGLRINKKILEKW